MRQARGRLGGARVGVARPPAGGALQVQVLRLEQTRLLREHLALQPEHLRHRHALAVQQTDALQLHGLQAQLAGQLGVRNVRVFLRQSQRGERVVVPGARLGHFGARRRRVGDGGVPQVPQRADLAVAVRAVLLAQSLQVLVRLALQAAHLGRQTFLVLRAHLGVAAENLLAQVVARRAQRAHLLAQAVLLLLALALALARLLHLARQVRLVLLQQLHLVATAGQLRGKRVALARRRALGAARGGELALRLGGALAEAVHGGRHLVVHGALRA